MTFVIASLAHPAPAQTFTILHSFTGEADGFGPYAGLAMDRVGRLYGTAIYGGNAGGNCRDYNDGCGVVFKLSRTASDWILTPLYSFQGGSDGALPQAMVAFGPNGSLYGATLEGGNASLCLGGCGTVFNLRPPARASANVLGNWSELQMYSFAGGIDGWAPSSGPLVFDQSGNIYGTTAYGGPTNSGTVYELIPGQGTWNKTILYSFSGGDDGAEPLSGLWLDHAGNLYGTTYLGGDGFGTVYEISPSGSGWTKTTIHNFQGFTDGESPIGGLIMDQLGNLFGTTNSGGMGGNGTVFELSPTAGGWTFTTIYSFDATYSAGGPTASLAMDIAGSLYGTILGNVGKGLVFKLTPSNGSWTYYDLHDFRGGPNDGEYAYGTVILDSHGNLYGTAVGGGTYGCDGGVNNCGVIWQIAPHSLGGMEAGSTKGRDGGVAEFARP